MLERVFPNRVIKDAVFSFFILLFLYGVTHNELVNPKPSATPGNWSVQKMQHPLLFGFAGHNYVALRDPLGDIVYEMHGLATDRTTGLWMYVGTKKNDYLKVWEFNEPRDYFAEKTYPGVVLAQGTKEDMLALWEKARACKDKINERNLEYPPLGIQLNGETINSNSVAYTLTVCMNKNARHIGIFTPGDNKYILEDK
jgi:hypothetical protein